MKLFSLFLFLLPLALSAQVNKPNDVSVPLHALKPDYPFPYDIPTREKVKASLDRIYYYLDSVTPIGFVNRKDNMAFTGSMPDTNIVFKKGDFRLTSYEWGVTYAGML